VTGVDRRGDQGIEEGQNTERGRFVRNTEENDEGEGDGGGVVKYKSVKIRRGMKVLDVHPEGAGFEPLLVLPLI